MKVEQKMEISQKLFICWPPWIWAEEIVCDGLYGVKKNDVICLLQIDMAKRTSMKQHQGSKGESDHW